MPEAAAPRPQRSPAGGIDRRPHISRPRSRRHLGGSGGAIVKGFPANFSRSASPRRAIWAMTNRVPQEKGRWQPNAARRKPNAATRSYSHNRSRRASQVAASPGEGPSTKPTPAVRPRPRERVFMPHSRPLRGAPGIVWKLPFEAALGSVSPRRRISREAGSSGNRNRPAW